MELNKIYNIDCLSGLKELENDSVNLTVTSPPYDNLRTYGNITDWNFEIFKPIAEELDFFAAYDIDTDIQQANAE